MEATGGENQLDVRAKALELARGVSPTAANISRIAKQTSADAAAWAFSQWNLRKRAKARGFEKADQMLFSKEALEQATHPEIAKFHASRFPEGVLVADLTTGLGSDLVALAARGRAIGYDTNDSCGMFSLAHLIASGLEANATVSVGDSMSEGWKFEYAFADPSRRVDGRRTLNPDDFSPNPTQLAERMSALRLGLIKLSPILGDEFLDSLGTRVEFVSYGGECREALVFCGSQVVPGRFAVLVEEKAYLPAAPPMLGSEEASTFIYEADPAAIRAHALGSIDNRLLSLGDSNGYLTSDSELRSPWLTAYRVLQSGKFDLRSVKSRLTDAGRVVVKSRAPNVDVIRVSKALSGKGKKGAILALYPVGKSVRFARLERI